MRFDGADFLDAAYATEHGLAVRIETHRRYGVSPVDPFDWMTEEAARTLLPARILDVGAGSGSWYRSVRRALGPRPHYVGLDRSIGMVASLREAISSDDRAEADEGDAQALGWPDGQFDWVGLHFMLYHVPDIAQAISEAYRVLAGGGLLLAATTTGRPYSELLELQAEGLREFGYDAPAPEGPAQRFSLEEGARFFPAQPKIYKMPAGFRFTSAEPALRYLASGPLEAAIAQAGAPQSVRRQLLLRIGGAIEERIAQAGKLDVTSETGFFLLQRPPA